MQAATWAICLSLPLQQEDVDAKLAKAQREDREAMDVDMCAAVIV
jgi:hypothetical protein